MINRKEARLMTAGLFSVWISQDNQRLGLSSATRTAIARPATSFPLRPSMAALAASSSAISTKPKPRERCVSRSVIILADDTSPNWLNASASSDSCIRKLRLLTNRFINVFRFEFVKSCSQMYAKNQFCNILLSFFSLCMAKKMVFLQIECFKSYFKGK